MNSLLRPFALIAGALLALILLVLFQAGALIGFFAENLAINLMILIVLVLGISLSLWRLYALAYEIDWLARVRTATAATNPDTLAGPRQRARLDIMGSFASVWRRFFDSNQVLTPSLAANLVDSAQARVDERRELSRYLITALVILGLLGTFWGLLGALVSMRSALGTLGAEQDFLATFSSALTEPLRNMGTAFSSSLFGLGASLFFGFIELQTARAQSNFVEDFETWLSSLVQATSTPGVSQGTAQPSAFAAAPASAVNSDQMETLAHLMRRSQQDTAVLNNNLLTLLEHLGQINQRGNSDQITQEKIVAAQANLATLSTQLAPLAALPDLVESLKAHQAAPATPAPLMEDEVSQLPLDEANEEAPVVEQVAEKAEVVTSAFLAPEPKPEAKAGSKTSSKAKKPKKKDA